LNAPILATLIGIAVAGTWMVIQASSPTRAVRVRNALLAREGAIDDFEWKPANPPPEFQKEDRPASRAFADAITRLELGSCPTDWDRALRIAGHLTAYAQDLGPIHADLETTYTRIRAGHGYCADFVKVFLGLAHAAGLGVRQWAFAFDGFGGHGHTVVEIFDPPRGKWLFVDVYNNFHACDGATGEPLGALEFRDALLRGTRAISIKPNGPGRAGFPLEHKLFAYYRSGLHQWYLIFGNAVFSYEAHPIVGRTSRLSVAMGQIVATIFGVRPSIRLLVTRENEAAVQELAALGHKSRIALAALGVLAVVLLVQLSVSK
jgi:hypothetical protein